MVSASDLGFLWSKLVLEAGPVWKRLTVHPRKSDLFTRFLLKGYFLLKIIQLRYVLVVFFSPTVIKYCPKATWVRKGLFGFYFQVTIKGRQGRKSRQELRNKNHGKGPERCPVVRNTHCSYKDRFSFQHPYSEASIHLEHKLEGIWKPLLDSMGSHTHKVQVNTLMHTCFFKDYEGNLLTRSLSLTPSPLSLLFFLKQGFSV